MDRRDLGAGSYGSPRKQQLDGPRLLVVEDEALIAFLIEDLVESFGCILAGRASTVAAALKLVGTVPIDGALIDVNLGGEMAGPVSQALSDKHIPLILVTGYEAPPLVGFPVVHKPFGTSELRDAIIQHFRTSGGGDLRGNQGH
jgi:DNA-binding response OmpR family regulator